VRIIPLIVFIVALEAVQIASPQTRDSAPLTAEQRRLNLESLEKVWTTVRDRHWDPKLGGVDWPAARQAALPKIRTAQNMQQVRAAMSEMLEKLGKSHFAIVPSEVYADLQPAARNPGSADSTPGGSARPKPPGDSGTPDDEEAGVGIEAAVIDGKALVIAIDEGSPAARAGVQRGWELVSVNGVAITQMIGMLAGINLRERQLYEQQILEELFLGPLNIQVQTMFSDAEGNLHQRMLDRTEPKGTLAQFGFLPPTRVWIETRRLEDTGPKDAIGYVRFNMFLDPEHLMPAFEKAVRDCFTCKGFVIDLRGNPGGIGAMSMGMAGWFVARRSRRLGTMNERDGATDYMVNPRPDTFNGPLAILVDGGSASTSEIFAAGLQDLGRAHVFGTKTAGAALPSMFIRLPNQDGFQFAEANYTSRNGQVLEGTGVTPDVIVKHTRESLLAGRDAPLDAAVEWIKSQK